MPGSLHWQVLDFGDVHHSYEGAQLGAGGLEGEAGEVPGDLEKHGLGRQGLGLGLRGLGGVAGVVIGR